MFVELKNIRDFIDTEKMKYSVDSLQARTLMTIHRYEEIDGVNKMVVHVFSNTGTYIGTIYNPEYIPTKQE